MPHRLTLSQMSELIRARKLSPVELMDAHLKQIEKHNPSVNAFIRVLEEPARAAAQVAEQRVVFLRSRVARAARDSRQHQRQLQHRGRSQPRAAAASSRIPGRRRMQPASRDSSRPGPFRSVRPTAPSSSRITNPTIS